MFYFNQYSMKSLSITTFALILAILVNAQQIPQYAMSTAVGSQIMSTSHPLNDHWGQRSQILYYPSEFPGAPAGNISAIYLKASKVLNQDNKFTELYIRMAYKTSESGVDSMSLNKVQPLSWYNTTTVFYAANYTLMAPIDSGQWFKFALQHPFQYDPNKNFIVDISHDSSDSPVIGIRVLALATGGQLVKRMYGGSRQFPSSTPWTWNSPGLADLVHIIGFDITPTSVSTVNNATGTDLYPNPFRSTFNLRAERSGTLRVSDIYGRNIASYTVSPGNNELSMPPCATDGMYVGRYFTEEGELVRTIRMSYSRE